MKKIFSILFALVLLLSLVLVTAAPSAAQITAFQHFKCYPVYEGTAPYPIDIVQLEDEFGAIEAVVEEAKFFCNPVSKWVEGMPPPIILNPDLHLTLYSLHHEEELQERTVKVENQFGNQQLVVSDPVLLGVPTWKLYPGGHDPPVGLDHFLLYEVVVDPFSGWELVPVGLEDQFLSEYVYMDLEPVYFANPVRKSADGGVTEIENPEAHLVFYRIESGYNLSREVRVSNQFDEFNSGGDPQWLEVYVDESYPALLAVPSEKGEQVVQYTLTISSTAGGSVTTPGEGTFKYDAGTEVSLVATPTTGYGFVNWAGDVDTIANANLNAATTTITIEGDYEITARFMGVGPTKTQMVIGSDTVYARDEAETEVKVTGTGTAMVTVAPYIGNPGGDPPTDFITMRKYIDVNVSDTTDVTEVEIRLYYTDAEVAKADIDEESLRLSWLNGEVWKLCSHSGVNTDGNYIWAKIRATDTTPTLSYLQGQGFERVGYRRPPPPPQPICFIATSAYGTDTAKEIDILREFRDTVLLPSRLGAEVVALYYKTSPPIARFISQHEALRTAVRVGFVDPIVAILYWSHDLWSARGLR